MLSAWDRLLLRSFRTIDRLDRLAQRRFAARDAQPMVGLGPGYVAAGRYRLQSILGEGGMGRVWLAEDLVERKPRALKEMRQPPGTRHAGESDHAAVDVAFRREYYTMTKLQHPNSVQVFDYGVLPTGDRFIVMELVRGRDLADLLKKAQLDLKQVYRILIELAHVLGFIHSRLYVHCDIKSENIRLTERGAVKLMDFGLMHQLGTTAGGTLKGSVPYMAPEIPKGGVIDARTDLYSLGVLAFELATGKLPFTGKTVLEVIGQHLERPPPSLRTLREVPEAFERLVHRLLAKEPRQRFGSAGELVRELSSLAGLPAEVQEYGARTSYLQAAELIGRSREQQSLKEVLERLDRGAARGLFVTAPAGVGKSRLVQEFLLAVKLAEIPIFTSYCRAEGLAPLAPLVDVLGQLVPVVPPATLLKHGPALAGLVPGIVERGVTPAPAPPSPAAAKLRQFEAIRGLLRETAAERSFILCVEDLHWADSTTIEYLNVAIRELADTRGMVLGTFRSNEVDRFSPLYATTDEGAATRLELLPLSRENTEELVSAMLGSLEDAVGFKSALFDTTRGNAFFVTETLRALIEQRWLRMDAGHWVVEQGTLERLPGSIEEAVTRRLGSLSPRTLTICQRLAPLGRILDLRLVRAVAALEDVELFAVLDELVERQFLQRVEGDYYFSHDTVRNGIYQATGEEARRDAHQQIAELLEQLHARKLDERSALIGYHYARGRTRDKAVQFLRRAADQSFAGGILLEGTRLLAQAADVLEQIEPDPKNPVLLGLWAQLVEVGSLAHPPTCARFADKLCPLLEQRVGGSAAYQQFHQQLRRLVERPGLTGRRKLAKIFGEQPLDPRSSDVLHLVPKLVVYRNAQAFAFGALGQMPRATEILDRMLADNPEPGPFRAAAQISKAVGLFHMGLWSTLQTASADAARWFEEHLERIHALPTRLYWNQAASYYWSCNARAAMGLEPQAEVFSKGMELSERFGFGDWRFFLALTQNVCSAVLGTPDAMVATYGALADTVRKLGNPPLMEARLCLFLPSYYLQRGEKDLAEAAIAKVERYATVLNDAWMRRYAQAYRAQSASEWGTLDEQQTALEAAFAAAREVPNFSRLTQLLSVQARLHSRRRAEAAAVESAKAALLRATEGPTANPWDECIARRTLAEVVGGNAAVEEAQAAVAAARKHRHPLQLGCSLLTLAEKALRVNRTLAAQALGEAEHELAALKASPKLEKAVQLRRRAAEVA